MMKSRLWAGPVAAISTFAAITLAGMMSVNSSLVRAQNGDNQGNESVKIQLGFAIAPVPLNLVGKDPALVGLGSYIVNAQSDCNGCHTLSAAGEFTPTGNPYLLSPPFNGKATPDPSHYLAGGRDFGPFPGGPGSIPHLYTRNLTPDKTGLPEGGHTFTEFLQIIRNGTDFDHIHPSCTGPGTPANCLPFPFNGNLLQVMPWPIFANMTEHDLLAIYTYLSAIPCNPGPSGLDPTLYQQNVCQ
jgi:mono/diheme cytochrome c family protein